jgi:hypothetical protein
MPMKITRTKTRALLQEEVKVVNCQLGEVSLKYRKPDCGS